MRFTVTAEDLEGGDPAQCPIAQWIKCNFPWYSDADVAGETPPALAHLGRQVNHLFHNGPKGQKG